MLIYIMKRNKIETFTLPTTISGNYWIFDKDIQGEKRSLIHVTAVEDKWQINSNSDTKIVINNQYIESATLEEHNFYNLAINYGKEIVTLYCCPSYDNSYKPYYLENDGAITIGRNSSNTIRFNSPYLKENHAVISYKNKQWAIQVSDDGAGVFVNKLYVVRSILKPGDIVFLMGLKIICMGEFLIINNPNGLVAINEMVLRRKALSSIEGIPVPNKEDEYYEIDEDAYFFRAPRFKSKVETQTVDIEQPPAKNEDKAQPFILTFGPMITMALLSIVTLSTAFRGLLSGTATILSSLPTFVMAFSMLAGTLLWPNLNRSWQKKEKEKLENLRQKKYTEYINKKANEIRDILTYQKNSLNENYPTLESCEQIIKNKTRNLWERTIENDDFLSVRLGTGARKPNIIINFPEEKFSLFEDDLLNEARNIVNRFNTVNDIPVAISLAEKYITAVVGTDKEVTTDFINSLIFQTVTLQSYEDVRIVVLTNEENSYKWEYIKSLPHCWNDNRTLRFYAANNDEIKQISSYLESEFNQRIESEEAKKTKEDTAKYKSFSPYYIIVTDDLKIVRNTEIIKKILDYDNNIGFSLLIQNDRLTNLPNECFEFISIDNGVGAVFENELVSEGQNTFEPIKARNIDIRKCCEKLSNIPIKMEAGVGPLPKTIGFLEMYRVGNISQLNILNTWKKNNPALSLAVPVGVEESGELFKLDLHEKFHGPHGLVAGMTGSGKSEFIITYILSLAVNFDPNEVAFVIIDYKGGGLAGAFHNKETGVKLPHLVGTITNLDTNEMNRSIASIDSELKRRQRLFNETRDKLNLSTIDIYKYQTLFREKKTDVPLPHLFIISDEFAELKSQQPEFMDNLMSIARIGRSLGVHLILATQKPAGVVNDQIWSNSKFRVCLKVQDKSDSMDMIKREDAASLKEAGRFYLQVGYNELFKLGQSAWCGVQYYETDKIKKDIDTSINFVDNTGYIYKTIDTDKQGEVLVSKGDELTNIVAYLDNLAKSQGYKVTPLWPDSMPEYINIESLKQKYQWKKENFNINIPIGEYDIPKQQKQELFTLPLTQSGNVAIYGINSAEREHVLKTIVYSAITNYTVDEINFYIVDLGAETLRIFSSSPHVDDVMILDEKEKIKTAIKMLGEILSERKKKYADYNGNYYDYCTKSGKQDPTIVFAINNFDTFIELFPEYDDTFTKMSRDCARYGINLLFTLANASNTKYRLRQNIKNLIVLQMGEAGDYSYVLANARRMQPSKINGRGLTDIDGEVYELEIASIAKTDDETNKIIKEVNDKLSTIYVKKAKEVPVLPDIVTVDKLKDELKGLNRVPIGIDTDSLKIVTADYKNNNSNIIITQEVKNFKHFIVPFVDELNLLPNTTVMFVDAPKDFKDLNISKKSYINRDYDKVITSIKEYFEKIFPIYEKNDHDKDSLEKYPNIVLIINNFNFFVDKLSPESKNFFAGIVQASLETQKCSIIILDTLTNIKSNEYNEIFQKLYKSNCGVWIGNGIYDQMTLRLSKSPSFIKQELKNDYGYIVKNGNPIQIKLLSDKDLSLDDDDEEEEE